mmetsp:Transcript_46121/g.99957  ORF Transcript_46121/g.99957 Transcript_46121/m.99957 type:complete len:96 (+) Transcript_46121:1546-1833(+)
MSSLYLCLAPAADMVQEKEVLERMLDHSYIVDLKGLTSTPSDIGLVLEYLPGGDLAERLSNCGGHFDSKTTLAYTAMMVLALEALHTSPRHVHSS